ncbi:MAG: hypothetical protein ABJE95_22680 [Byssovorax sp.]
MSVPAQPIAPLVERPGAALEPRPARVRALLRLMGTPDRSVRQLALGIRATTHRQFDEHVVPLVEACWPALKGQAFDQKLRIGACDLYASAPYTVLLCAPDRPLLIRAVTDAGNRWPLSFPALALLGRGAMEILGRVAYLPVHRRIILISAFIVVVDHVLDHCMTDPPRERGERLLAVIDGQIRPEGPELSLVRALAVAMGESLSNSERAAFEGAMIKVREWIRAEVQAMLGEPDPLGLGHRLAGVEGTIDGLLFPVARFAGKGARPWMVDVSMFVQIMDDWLDYEADCASSRPTPVTTGRWTFADVESSWQKTLSGIEALVREAGLTSPHYVRFVRSAYVLMMHEVTQAMIQRPDE